MRARTFRDLGQCFILGNKGRTDSRLRLQNWLFRDGTIPPDKIYFSDGIVLDKCNDEIEYMYVDISPISS